MRTDREDPGEPTVDLSILGDWELELDWLEDRAQQILRLLELGDSELSLVICDDSFIQVLNRDYRAQDAPTDVLSFAQREGEGADAEDPILGDVVISLSTAERQADELGHSIETELLVLLVHGILHLLGHDHEDPDEARLMSNAEAELLARLKQDSPYGLIGRAQ